jgi:DNA polymerase III epsilon subunit-like protein
MSTSEPSGSHGPEAHRNLDDIEWILLDTETSGLGRPIFVVELAAQRMCGWRPRGVPFRKLFNQNQDIPAEASRVHGYTREILERDGEPALRVYCEFADYVGDLPLVSFNLDYDLEEVLKPEWKRLGITPIGRTGFCAMRLAQRLLDPVPARNCKLQTLRQYYELPRRGAHTALGDVETGVDLCAKVLHPMAERRGLDSWAQLSAYAWEEWYPSRLAFGKHKGRLFWEARRDKELHGWLKWLASSSNSRSCRMGSWYLRQLASGVEPERDRALFATPSKLARQDACPQVGAAGVWELVIYSNPKLDELRQLVAGARARLAELETDYTRERAKVDALRAKLFNQLKAHYQRRDRLRLVVEYRKKLLDGLMRGDEGAEAEVKEKFQKAQAESDRGYEEAAGTLAEKKPLTEADEREVALLWKRLVKLYHPDRFMGDPDKRETYEKLTTAINRAKDNGDVATLREIADDPHGFILRQGWTSLDFTEEEKLSQLRRLLETLQVQIIVVLESLNELRASPDYELYQLSIARSTVVDDVVREKSQLLDCETRELEQQAAKLASEIQELAGQPLNHVD